MKDLKFLFERFVLQQHKFEPKVKKALKKIHGRIFVDIGANVGTYSLMLRNNFRTVYAFEPNPKVAQVLRDRVERMNAQNVTVLSLALSDRDGTTDFYPNEEFSKDKRPKGRTYLGGGSLLQTWDYKPTLPHGRDGDIHRVSKNPVSVRCDTFDNTIGHADLVKIDVEGAEFTVLEGMKGALSKHAVRELLIELHDRTRKDELARWLEKYQYRIAEWVDPNHARIMCWAGPDRS